MRQLFRINIFLFAVLIQKLGRVTINKLLFTYCFTVHFRANILRTQLNCLSFYFNLDVSSFCVHVRILKETFAKYWNKYTSLIYYGCFVMSCVNVERANKWSVHFIIFLALEMLDFHHLQLPLCCVFKQIHTYQSILSVLFDAW